MAMILCGWCGKPTVAAGRCQQCGHDDPSRPWTQRAQEPPPWDQRQENLRRLTAARKQLEIAGQTPTAAALAELLGIDDRTVRRWQKLST